MHQQSKPLVITAVYQEFEIEVTVFINSLLLWYWRLPGYVFDYFGFTFQWNPILMCIVSAQLLNQGLNCAQLIDFVRLTLGCKSSEYQYLYAGYDASRIKMMNQMILFAKVELKLKIYFIFFICY